jgi:CheY-like chemotaxis protein
MGDGDKILLVDDEASVVTVGSRMLKALGYASLSAGGGQEAVEVFSQQGESISGVILDLSMPDMDGSETLVELRRIRPDVPVVISSGYGAEQISDRFSAQKPTAYIQKPFRLEDLKAVLSQAFG